MDLTLNIQNVSFKIQETNHDNKYQKRRTPKQDFKFFVKTKIKYRTNEQGVLLMLRH